MAGISRRHGRARHSENRGIACAKQPFPASKEEAPAVEVSRQFERSFL